MIFGFSTFALNSVLVRNLLKNLKQRSRLKVHDGAAMPSLLEGLTLAMPVRNEEKNLREFLPRLALQSSLPERILFLDDESSDGTASVLDYFKSSENLRGCEVEVLSGIRPPPHYRGKVWALKQLTDQVKTPFVLFMDADVRLAHSHALFSLYSEAFTLRQGKYSFATVFPRPKSNKAAGLLVNQIFVHLYYLLPARWSNSTDKSLIAGCGQVMLINVQKLREYALLEQIAHSTHDGLQLARAFKEKEGFVNFYDGGALFQSEYYATLLDAFRGFTRNCFEADVHPAMALAVSALLFWAFVLPFILLPFAILNPWWIAALMVILWGQYRLHQELDLNPVLIAGTPVAATLSCAVHIWSAVKTRLHFSEQWHGRILD